MTVKFSSFVASASLLLFCSVSAAALADGMPFDPIRPQQNLTPIDHSLNAPLPAPAASAVAVPATATLSPVVPESRTVEVQPYTSFFGLSVGLYSFTHGSTTTAFNAEWQPGVKVMGSLQPLFGAMATTHGAMLGYAGLGMPYNLADHVFVMPSFSLGFYKHGHDYNLNRTIVARPGVEVAYQFDDKSRLGLSFNVLTNGKSFQARDRLEMVSLTYTMPLNALAGESSSYSEPAPSAAVVTPAAAPVAIAPAPAAPAATTQKPLPHELP